MNPPQQPELESLRAELRTVEAEFAEAMTRMYQVGNHLARVRTALDTHEARAASHQASPRAPVPGTHPAAPVPPPPLAHPGPTSPPSPPPPPMAPAGAGGPGNHPWHAPPPPRAPLPPPGRPTTPAVPWWQRDGLVAKALAVVGASVTLIGIALLLALAIQAGYFGPLARVVTGAVLAAALVGAGLLVKQRQRGSAGALGLVGTGFAAAYLDILAVTRIYEWVPPAVGVLVAGLVAAVGLVLARAWGSQLLAVLIVLGVAVLAPVIAPGEVLLVGSFLLALTIAAYPAQIGRHWVALDVARVLPTTLYAMIAVGVQGDGHRGTVMAVVLALVVLGTAAVGLRRGGPLSPNLLVLVATLPALVAGVAETRWVGLGVLVLVVIAHVAAAALTPVRGIDLPWQLRGVCLFVAAVTSIAAAARLVEGPYVPLAIVVVAISWVAASAVIRDRSLTVAAMITAVVALTTSPRLIPLAWLESEAPSTRWQHLAEAAALVVLLALLGVAARRIAPGQRALAATGLAAAALLAPLTLVLAGSLTARAVPGTHPADGFVVGHMLASVLWMVMAAALLVRGLGRGEHAGTAVRVGLALAALVVAKLLFYDLAALDGLPRVLSFIVAGIVLLGMGVWYAQALERSRTPVDNSTAE